MIENLTDYDNALLHLGDAVADVIEKLSEETIAEGKEILSNALYMAMYFRTAIGAPGHLDKQCPLYRVMGRHRGLPVFPVELKAVEL